MTDYSKSFEEILKSHQMWISSGGSEGNRMDFSGISFKGAKFSGCDFTETEMNGVNFEYANLSNARISQSQLSRAQIIESPKWKDPSNFIGTHRPLRDR